jgi:hypothetical protein
MDGTARINGGVGETLMCADAFWAGGVGSCEGACGVVGFVIRFEHEAWSETLVIVMRWNDGLQLLRSVNEES